MTIQLVLHIVGAFLGFRSLQGTRVVWPYPFARPSLRNLTPTLLVLESCYHLQIPVNHADKMLKLNSDKFFFVLLDT